MQRVDAEKTQMATESLKDKIITSLRSEGFLPPDEIPFIPELKHYNTQIVSFICNYANEKMKTKGLNYDEIEKMFSFVFLRANDIGWQWHQADDGSVDYELNVGNPFNDESNLSMPDEMLEDIKDLQIDELVCSEFIEWFQENSSKLKAQGIDIWPPLFIALTLTFDAAHSILLKAFGYR